MSSVPYTFANSVGNIPLAYLDANFSNVKAYANTSGTVTTAAQPNITSVGTLTSLTVTGNVTATNFTGNITGNISNAVYAETSGTAGTVTTAAQPNITSVGTLTVLTASGNIRTTGGAFVGSAAGLTSIPGANVTGTVANATYATTTGTVITAAQPNITSVGTLSSLTVSGNIVAGNVTGATLLSATNLTGTLTTAAQPNITSVGTLSSLTVSGNVSANNLSITNKITTTGNVTFGNNSDGVLYTDNDGFSVLGSNNSSTGAYLFASNTDAVVGAHSTYGALLMTDYIVGNVSTTRALAWNNGNLSLDLFNVTAGNITNVANITASNTIVASIIKTTPTLVGSLPSAATIGAGARAFVTDADSVTFGNLLVGGAGNSMPVWSDGTNWLIG